MAHSLSNRNTKIVATIGPASAEKDQLRELIQSGLNVARLNFSHGKFSEHKAVVEKIRQLSDELGAPVGILQDLQGPKIRLNNFAGERTLKSGDQVILSDATN